VTIEPIRLVNGVAHFCQEFFDDARLPAGSALGEVGGGWEVATRLLAHERTATGGGSIYSSGKSGAHKSARVGMSQTDLIDLAGGLGRSDDAVTRQLVADAHVLDTVQGHLVQRISAAIGSGQMPPAASALLKLYAGTANSRRATIATEIAGPEAVSYEGGSREEEYAYDYLARQTMAIGGGTNEIQRNIISERVLGMPREYSADRGKPFKDVRQSAPVDPQ
jgi:alkylation response protein AidB-like acyl-CoA dehydrogenase